jgi:hypothetical protein
MKKQGQEPDPDQMFGSEEPDPEPSRIWTLIIEYVTLGEQEFTEIPIEPFPISLVFA